MMLAHCGISLRRALAMIGLSASMFYYKRKRDDSEALKLVSEYAQENPTHGQDMMAKVFKRSHGWNHKKTERIYHLLQLPVIRKRRLRRLAFPKMPLTQPIVPNETWSMDFMSDSLLNGSKIRILNVVDDDNREYLGYDIARSLPAERVTRTLDDLIDFHGKPRRIRIDNGPEYRSHKLALWAKENAIELRFIQPGKPTQNSYIERFNGTYRTEVLNSFLFDSLQQVWNETEKFQFKYNNQRPHSALMDMPPVEFKKHREAQINGLLQISTQDNKSKVEFT